MVVILDNFSHEPGYLWQILRDYLRNCSLLYEMLDSHGRVESTRSWNISLDSFLRLGVTKELCLVSYANDVSGGTASELTEVTPFALITLLENQVKK